MLKETIKTPKTGNEPFTLDKKPLDLKLSDFWRWSVSDLVSNATRGRLAEFIVAAALKIPLNTVRDEWGAFDLMTKEGIKVEVKSAAYLQSWSQKKPSSISFSIKPSRYWDSETNVQEKESKRQADFYVFCLLKHMDKNTINPLDLDQWDFYVLSKSQLDGYRGSKHSITLKSLIKITPKLSFSEVRKQVSSLVRT
jgi:hypothetical protein